MKKVIFLLFSTIILVSCSEYARLKKLDEILDRSKEYEEAFRRQTDSLRLELSQADSDNSRFRTAWKLSERYKVYNIDTCLIYSQIMIENAHSRKESIIARSALVYALASMGQIDQAETILCSIPTDFPYDPDMYIYYESAHHLYFTRPKFRHYEKDKCRQRCHEIRMALLQNDTTSYEARTYLIHEKNFVKDYEGAERTAISILEMKDLPLRYRGINEYNLAHIYRRLGQMERTVSHLIEAAIIDLSTSTKEYNSLYDLAKYLHKNGDNERACRYMLQTLNDAIFCNYKDHYQRSASASQLIYQIYERESQLKKRRQTQLFATLFALLLSTILLLIVQHVYSGRVRKVNDKLRLTNLRLKDGNTIRDSILSKYMEKSVYYIEKVDENKSLMRKTYRKEGINALLQLLRSPSFADTEFKNYYQDFDSSILDLFPSFVEDVNELMSPNSRFIVKAEGSLCTELRILALIRLGITDSPKIAKALNISIHTTYCYRHRMRHNATCKAEEFEKRVREIGLYD